MAIASPVASSTASSLCRPMTSWRRPLRQLPLHVPLRHQRERDLVDLLAGEGLSDVEQLVEQLHVADDVGQVPVGVGGHHDQLDVTVDRPDPADRLDAVDPGRHPHVDVGQSDRPTSPPVRSLMASQASSPLIECRRSKSAEGGSCPPRRTGMPPPARPPDDPTTPGLQHLVEVVVDLQLVVDDEHTPVRVITDFHGMLPNDWKEDIDAPGAGRYHEGARHRSGSVRPPARS